jgi:hypothetical protein
MTSNAPTDLGQHVEAIEPPRVDATTFRQGWRVRTRLDSLLSDRRITPGQWQAAVEYRDAWARVLQAGGGSPGGLRVSGGADRHHRLLGLLDTITRLRATETWIGRLAASLCFACVVEDRSWASIAATCHRNPETVRDWTVLALRSLAVVWAGGQRGGLDVCEPPRTARRRVRAS